MSDVIEFWLLKGGFITKVETQAPPPPVGAKINIRGEDYEVAVVDYTIDRADEILGKQYRRNVHLKKVEPDE